MSRYGDNKNTANTVYLWFIYVYNIFFFRVIFKKVYKTIPHILTMLSLYSVGFFNLTFQFNYIIKSFES